MAKLLRLRRGTDTQHTTFTGAEGEVTVNTTNDSLHVHDGTTAGGRELLRKDLNNLGAGAITSTHIADGTIVNADLNASAAIAHTKLANITAGSVLMGNASAVPTATALSGDVTVNSSGVTAISSGVIVDGDINAAAAIAKTKISGTAITAADSGTVTSTMIADGTIVNADINASAAIAGTKISPDFGSQAISTTVAVNANNLTTSGGAGAVTIGGNGDIRLNNGNWTGDAVKIQHHNNQLYIQGGNGTYSHIFRNLNGTDRVLIDSSGHLLPGTNNAYDLGTSSLRWRNVYTNDLNLSNEGGANDVDGTWGSWTIQEGEDDLFLLNRRNGKKYKFNLSEVN